MDRLILLRHGQADAGSESGDDFDRRLAPHGIVESRAMGLRLADLGYVPDLALISTAARARGTWEAVGMAFPATEVRFEDELYHAFSDVIRTLAFGTGTTAATVLVVGHNPGLQELTVTLLRESHAPSSLIARAVRGYPTAAASVFQFDAEGRPHADGLFFPNR
jgi:phosphohistidine phosphatase